MLKMSFSARAAVKRHAMVLDRTRTNADHDTQHEIPIEGNDAYTVNLEFSPVLRVHFILKSPTILSWLVTIVKYLHKAQIHLQCVAKEQLYRRFVINQQNGNDSI